MIKFKHYINATRRCDCGAVTHTIYPTNSNVKKEVKVIEQESFSCFRCKQPIGFRDLMFIWEQ